MGCLTALEGLCRRINDILGVVMLLIRDGAYGGSTRLVEGAGYL